MSTSRRKRPTRAQQHRAVVRAHRHLYDDLLAFQGGGCAICGKPPGARRHAMDHDHKTMELRGILCTHCNRMLTSRLTIWWLWKAYHYLNRTPFEAFNEGRPA